VRARAESFRNSSAGVEGGQRARDMLSRIGTDACLLDSPGHWLLNFFASDFFFTYPLPPRFFG
jgi:hypothetical protein